MDSQKKSNLLKYSGLTVAVFALFTLASAASYLFTWQADQSLLSNPEMMEKGVEVANWCGKIGYKWSKFLVSDCFGLGAFVKNQGNQRAGHIVHTHADHQCH